MYNVAICPPPVGRQQAYKTTLAYTSNLNGKSIFINENSFKT